MNDRKVVDGKTIRNYVQQYGRQWQKDWRDDLKAFDVLITKSGDLRVVRQAVYFSDGKLSHIVLAIRRCSWTKHATTIYERSELKNLKFRKAEVKFVPKEHDFEFQKFIDSGAFMEVKWKGPHKFDCIDAFNFA